MSSLQKNLGRPGGDAQRQLGAGDALCEGAQVGLDAEAVEAEAAEPADNRVAGSLVPLGLAGRGTGPTQPRSAPGQRAAGSSSHPAPTGAPPRIALQRTPTRDTGTK